jgi:GNAT superfamily N-acetyltransferase
MTNEDFAISPASPDETRLILRMLADIEGWRMCIEAAEAWLAADPESFFIGRLNGEHIAHVSAVRYEENYGFIGCYWVRKDRRGQGFGVRMYRHALEHLKGCNIGISGLPYQVQNFCKSGFIPFSQDTRYVGKVAKLTVPEAHACHIVPYEETMLDSIAVYDRQVFPSVRKALLRAYFKMPNSFTYVYIENGNVRGYAVVHAVHGSNEIGPCFADNREIAKALVITVVNCLPDDATLGMNTQEENPESAQLIAELPEYEMKVFMLLKRLYTTEPPKIDVTKLWSPTGFSTG